MSDDLAYMEYNEKRLLSESELKDQWVNAFTPVGRFEKVSLEQFKEGIQRFHDSCELLEEQMCFVDEVLQEILNELKLPDRSTIGSAGYDFYFPFGDYTLQPGETIIIPTGVRVFIRGTFFLGIFPKSGLSFDFKVRLDDTIAIIDADYYEAANEGHIYLKITNENRFKPCILKHNMKIVQGIFIPFGLTYDDNVTAKRTGGLGHSDPMMKLKSAIDAQH